MITNKNQNLATDKHFFIRATAGGLFLLILLVALTGILISSGRLDPAALSRELAGIFPQSMRTVLGDQARLMGLPLTAGSQAYWFFARAGGGVAYLLLWMATCWGMIMSSKVLKGVINAPASFALHEYLPILGVIFAAVHALALLGDTYIGFNLWQLLIPFSSSYEPFWTGLGSLSLYLFLALIASFYLRKHIGQKVWRAFHMISYLAFLMALLHGLMAGSDSGTLAMRTLYLVSGSISLFLLYYRMLSYVPRTRSPHN